LECVSEFQIPNSKFLIPASGPPNRLARLRLLRLLDLAGLLLSGRRRDDHAGDRDAAEGRRR
jgi:hypothetical protein